MNQDREYKSAQNLLAHFAEFREQYSLQSYALNIDVVIVRDIAKRYWRDVDRLHKFHDYPAIDCHKIAGYITYWIAKLRPIYISDMKTYSSSPEKWLYINELFACYVAMGRIYAHADSVGKAFSVSFEQKFIDSFLYTLKYRITSGDNLSLMYYQFEKMGHA